MKRGKKRGGVSADERKLAESQRRLQQDIDNYLAKNESLSGNSIRGLRRLESILMNDMRDLEGGHGSATAA